jgi:hypothetical protein
MSERADLSQPDPEPLGVPSLSDEEARKWRIIQAARHKVEQHCSSDTEIHLGGEPDTGSGRLEVRCPSCFAPMKVAADTTLTDLTCSACGSHFSLVDQSKVTRMAPSLSKLGRFELIERIGVGGFGSVWKARDKELDRTVALKIPRQGLMSSEEQEKFFREARAAAQLRHPNIVSVHEVGRDGETIFIVSDFVRGVTLGDKLTGQQLTSGEAVELCAKIADSLHHAHEHTVVHRDLKPSNIMIDGDGQPHLMDFGLARREVGEVTVTVDGQVLGTPAYMSPEQAQGDAHNADRRSDVYSLGVIFFQLLTGELPFRGNARMLMHQVIHDEPPSPRKLNAIVSKDLETITLKCLEKQPARRYQTAEEFALDLRRFLDGEPIHARPAGPFERAWRWAKRKPAMATTAALVTFLAVASPLVALREQRMRILLEERFIERDNLIRQKEHEASLAKNRIAELSRQLDVWEGRANPWDFWPPTQDESLRQNIAADLLTHSRRILTKSLRRGRYSQEDTVRGFWGLAAMADVAGRRQEAREYYELAGDQLFALRREQPEEPRYLRAAAECHLHLARLADDAEEVDVANELRKAREIYMKLAAEEYADAIYQIGWLESEWTSARVSGFDSGQEQLTRVAEIRRSLPGQWPTDPAELYRLACYLSRREPILAEPAAAEVADGASTNTSVPSD